MDMNTIQEVVKLAVDRHNGSILQYTPAQADVAIREALIEANNGKTYLDWRDVRDGKCGAFYSIIEQIIQKTVVEGLSDNEYWNSLVDTKLVDFGDKAEFVVEGNDLFVVAEASGGNQGIRRQRIIGTKNVSPVATWKIVKIYDELERILGGKVDFGAMVSKVSDSFKRKLQEDILAVFSAVTQDDLGGSTYAQSGSYSEDAMLDLVSHVEARAYGDAIIYATKKGAKRLLTNNGASNQANDDLYKNGLYGFFYGTPIVKIPQRHKVGTDQFIYDDDTITVICSAGKPIKHVIEGTPIMNMDNPMTNPDMVQNYFYAQKSGLGFALSDGCIGRYTVTSN